MNWTADFEPYRHIIRGLFDAIDDLQSEYQSQSSRAQPIYRQDLRLVTLGSEAVIFNSQDIPLSAWRVALARQLVFFHHFLGKQRKEDLGLTFWPDHDAEALRQILANTLQRVRRALPDGIVYIDGYYQINPAFRVTCDADEFRSYVERARHLPRQHIHTADLYTQALRLYKGDCLPNVFSDWVNPIRLDLHRLYVEALIGSGDCALAHDNIPDAVSSYERALREAPYSEEIARALMRCYGRLRQKERLRDTFQGLKQRLYDDLGIDPDAETVFCYENAMNA